MDQEAAHLKTERDCSYQACRNSKEHMGGWALRGGICQANKGQAFPGTGSLEGGLQRNSFSGDRGTTLLPFPSGCASTEELGGWLIPIHTGPQPFSCPVWLNPNHRWTILPASFLPAPKYYWRKSHSRADGFHYNSGSPAPRGTKG